MCKAGIVCKVLSLTYPGLIRVLSKNYPEREVLPAATFDFEVCLKTGLRFWMTL